MFELVSKIHTILNLVKGFEVGYSSKTVKDGKFLIEYQGERYSVKIEKIESGYRFSLYASPSAM